MPDYSRPLGDAVKNARTQQGLTKKQLADKISVDERTITSIETYKSNTTIEVLYPLLRTLNIDPREIFNPEMGRESHADFLSMENPLPIGKGYVVSVILNGQCVGI